jgi:hypothetical protein
MTELLKDKLKKFFSSEELSTELLDCQTPEDMKQLFAENGIDVNDDEVKIIMKYVDKFVEKDGKLSENDLDQISGGASLTGVISSPLRLFSEAVVAMALAPSEGWKNAVINHRNRMRKIEMRDKSKQN